MDAPLQRLMGNSGRARHQLEARSEKRRADGTRDGESHLASACRPQHRRDAEGVRPDGRAAEREAIGRRTLPRPERGSCSSHPPRDIRSDRPAADTQFRQDESPDPSAKAVDRLLASLHYGERWGRHWLDLARYLPSEGFNAYRDCVIRSFNKDTPYDHFVLEQMAGDL